MKKESRKGGEHPADVTRARQGDGNDGDVFDKHPGRPERFAPPVARTVVDQFATGEDVGHGVDHDCAQCRQTRHKLALDALDTRAIGDPNDRDSSAVDTSAFDSTLPQTFDITIETALGNVGAQGGQFKEVATPAIDAMLEDARATAALNARFDDLDQRLNDTLIEVFAKHGMTLGLGFESDDTEIIDELLLTNPACAVMMMRGFIPDDTRWHIELNTGPARAAVAHHEREIAVKIAAITIFDGRAGLQFEREFAEWATAQKRAHDAAATAPSSPPGWTGQTQAIS